jgi:putative membrane protein
MVNFYEQKETISYKGAIVKFFYLILQLFLFKKIFQKMLTPSLQKNDKKATIFILTVSAIVFLAVTALGRFTLNVDLPFNKHLFATANAFINATVVILLLTGLFAVKQKNYTLHKSVMLLAILLSVFFLVSYICHHLFTDPTKFGDANHDNIISEAEKIAVGLNYYIYYFILFTHIPLAGIILPFILFTAYRALIGEYDKHKKLVRITWPIWLYVAITGVMVYVLISPYYI